MELDTELDSETQRHLPSTLEPAVSSTGQSLTSCQRGHGTTGHLHFPRDFPVPHGLSPSEGRDQAEVGSDTDGRRGSCEQTPASTMSQPLPGLTLRSSRQCASCSWAPAAGFPVLLSLNAHQPQQEMDAEAPICPALANLLCFCVALLYGICMCLCGRKSRRYNLLLPWVYPPQMAQISSFYLSHPVNHAQHVQGPVSNLS